MRRRIDTRVAMLAAWRRARSAWPPVTLASVAASLAWLIAHRLLGHPQPFFAPIAAAIALSTSRIQRSRRIAQMVSGVLLGIVIGELLDSALGTSTVALGLIVFVTLNAALLSGAGFFSEGMMFANQAAASAILVVTLHRHGTGAERAIDVLVGGAVALILGVGLFPAEPLALLRQAEQAVMSTLARTLTELAAMLSAGERSPEGWALKVGHEIHQELAGLARARTTARTNVRVAPRRWHLRVVVDHEDRRTAELNLVANAVLSLVRAWIAEVARGRQVSPGQQEQITALAGALDRLAYTPQPWPAGLRAEIDEALATVAGAEEPLPDPGAVLGAVLRATADDLTRVVDVS